MCIRDSGKMIAAVVDLHAQAHFNLAEVGIKLPAECGQVTGIVGLECEALLLGRLRAVGGIGGCANCIQRLFGRSFCSWDRDDTDLVPGVNRSVGCCQYAP